MSAGGLKVLAPMRAGCFGRPAFSAFRTKRPGAPRLRAWHEWLGAYLAARAQSPQEVTA